MDVKGIVHTKEGKYEVTVELNSEQHQFIFQAGLGFLLSAGALPITTVDAKTVIYQEDEDDKEPTIN